MGAFHKLQSDTAYREALGKEGAAFIHREHSPERCARLYAEFLETVMSDPLTRTRLLADYVGREVGRAVVGKNGETGEDLLLPFEAVLTSRSNQEK